MVYRPEYGRERERFPGPPLKLVDSLLAAEFRAANEGLRRIYEGLVVQICGQVPHIGGKLLDTDGVGARIVLYWSDGL